MDRVIGVAVTPVGKEPTARLTFPVKPFIGEAVTVTLWAAPPGVTVIEEGTMARLKSPEAVVGALEVPPPPHPAKAASRETAHRRGKRDRMSCSENIQVVVCFFRLCNKYGYGIGDPSIPYCPS
jgi:hypothetical protein